MLCKKRCSFTKFTGKHLCQSLFLNKVASLRPATLLKKRLWHRRFVKLQRTPFLQNTSGWLLLAYVKISLQRNRLWKPKFNHKLNNFLDDISTFPLKRAEIFNIISCYCLIFIISLFPFVFTTIDVNITNIYIDFWNLSACVLITTNLNVLISSLFFVNLCEPYMLSLV